MQQGPGYPCASAAPPCSDPGWHAAWTHKSAGTPTPRPPPPPPQYSPPRHSVPPKWVFGEQGPMGFSFGIHPDRVHYSSPLTPSPMAGYGPTPTPFPVGGYGPTLTPFPLGGYGPTLKPFPVGGYGPPPTPASSTASPETHRAAPQAPRAGETPSPGAPGGPADAERKLEWVLLTDIHYAYGVGNRNTKRAQARYRKEHPSRPTPHAEVFADVHRLLRRGCVEECLQAVRRLVETDSLNDSMDDADAEDVDDGSLDNSVSVITSVSGRDGNHEAASGEINCRLARNQSEKARRDRVSAYIGHMQTHLPILNNSAKKVDKITILRIGANQVRMSKIAELLGESIVGEKVPFRLGDVAEALVMEELKAVCFVVAENCKIVYVTKTVENVLGHTQVELFGQDMKKLVHPDDHAGIDACLRPDGSPPRCLEPIVSSDESSSDDTGTSASTSSSLSSPSCVSSPPPPQGPPPPPPPPEYQKRELYFRIQQRPVSRSDSPQFEDVRADGFLLVHKKATAPAGAAHGHRRKSHDSVEGSGNVLCIVVKLLRETSSATMNCMDLPKNEYYTRHDMQGNFLFTDQRISFISGYLPEEVHQVNAFKYMHKDDAKWAQVALQQMFKNNSPTGDSCYRLLAKDGSYIFMKTFGFLERDHPDAIPNSFICINRLVSSEEAKAAMETMRKTLAPLVPDFSMNQRSGVIITEVTDGDDVGQHETIKSTSQIPPDMRAALAQMSVSIPRRNAASASTDAAWNDFGAPGRPSVVHTTGAPSRKRKPSEADSSADPLADPSADPSGRKRTCPGSPAASASLSAPGTPSLASPLPHLVSPGDGCGTPGVSDALLDLPLSEGVFADLEVSDLVLEGVDAGPVSGGDPMFSPQNVSLCPNVQWGRSGPSSQTGPSLAPSDLGDVGPTTIFLGQMGVNGVASDLLLHQLGTNLESQGNQMRTIQDDLSRVPHNDPSRLKIENKLSEVQEEHTRQEKCYQELQCNANSRIYMS